jgi:acyl-CoA thioesterase-1
MKVWPQVNADKRRYDRNSLMLLFSGNPRTTVPGGSHSNRNNAIRIFCVHLCSTAALLLLLGACTSAPKDGKAKPASPAVAAVDSVPTDEPSIVILGTSLTAGFGLDPDRSYPAALQRIIDSAGYHYHIVNAGVSGESSAGALRRIGWVLSKPPAVLIIETGANDGLRGQSTDSLRQNLAEIVDSARRLAPNATLLLAGMEALPNLGPDYARKFHAVYPSLAATEHIPLIPFLLKGVAGIDSLNQNDGIHPNPVGARIVAHNVWSVLQPLLRSSK